MNSATCMMSARARRLGWCGGLLSVLLAASLPAQIRGAEAGDAQRLFDRGRTWEQFLTDARAQRDEWHKAAANAAVPPDLVERFRRASANLRIVVVAEDRCPDSLNALPYLAALSSAASIPLRIVDRKLGEPLMQQHRTPDGRPATPTVVLLRDGEDAGAWIERPAVVQSWFLSMAANPDSARKFGDRQAWFDADRGHTVLAEVIALAERTSAGK